MNFADKVILVVGGATGIGRATARSFAKAGATVMIGDIDDRGEEAASLISEAGGRAQWQRVDVIDRTQVDALVKATVDQFGNLHAAFNNAGVLPPPKRFAEIDELDFDQTIAVDLKGVFNCMQAEIRHMLDNGGGAIVNTASVGGIIANPNMAPYIAAKHGVIGLTRSAAIEYARNGIRVNAIAPGLVRTAMTEPWFQNEEFIAAFYAASPIGRAADPQEISGMVLHLCSDEASFTNGQVFVIDGGQTAV
jgi:NAD(P)-dependent dehydrogenase (short-subunit alcohol dehydrogenase family)